MHTVERLTKVVIVSIFALSLLAVTACAPQSQTDTPATGESGGRTGEPDPLPDDPDSPKAITERKCSFCHSLEQVYEADLTEEGWRDMIVRMQGLGLVITDEEFEMILGYLSGL